MHNVGVVELVQELSFLPQELLVNPLHDHVRIEPIAGGVGSSIGARPQLFQVGPVSTLCSSNSHM